jgi:hypothetical protein
MKNGTVEKMSSSKSKKQEQSYSGERSTKRNKPKRGRRQQED